METRNFHQSNKNPILKVQVHSPSLFFISREAAEEFLKLQKENCFLLRPSSQEGCLALSLYGAKFNEVGHLLIALDENSQYQIHDDSNNINERFPSIEELLEKSSHLKGFRALINKDYQPNQSPKIIHKSPKIQPLKETRTKQQTQLQQVHLQPQKIEPTKNHNNNETNLNCYLFWKPPVYQNSDSPTQVDDFISQISSASFLKSPVLLGWQRVEAYETLISRLVDQMKQGSNNLAFESVTVGSQDIVITKQKELVKVLSKNRLSSSLSLKKISTAPPTLPSSTQNSKNSKNLKSTGILPPKDKNSPYGTILHLSPEKPEIRQKKKDPNSPYGEIIFIDKSIEKNNQTRGSVDQLSSRFIEMPQTLLEISDSDHDSYSYSDSEDENENIQKKFPENHNLKGKETLKRENHDIIDQLLKSEGELKIENLEKLYNEIVESKEKREREKKMNLSTPPESEQETFLSPSNFSLSRKNSQRLSKKIDALNLESPLIQSRERKLTYLPTPDLSPEPVDLILESYDQSTKHETEVLLKEAEKILSQKQQQKMQKIKDPEELFNEIMDSDSFFTPSNPKRENNRIIRNTTNPDIDNLLEIISTTNLKKTNSAENLQNLKKKNFCRSLTVTPVSRPLPPPLENKPPFSSLRIKNLKEKKPFLKPKPNFKNFKIKEQSPILIPSKNFQETHQKKCIEELISTEEKYLESLHRMIYTFSKDLVVDKILSTIEAEKLFPPELTNIFGLHLILIEKIKKKEFDGFQILKEKISVYKGFISAYNESIQFGTERYEQDKKFRDYIEKKVSLLSINSGKRALSFLLITPIQRITRYPLLLSELLNLTPPENEIYQEIKNALHLSQELATIINEIKKIVDSKWHMNHLNISEKPSNDPEIDENLRVLDFHKFEVYLLNSPTTCKYCSKRIWGPGFKCEICKYPCHSQCVKNANEEKQCSHIPDLQENNRLFIDEFLSLKHTVITTKFSIEKERRSKTNQLLWSSSPSKRKRDSTKKGEDKKEKEQEDILLKEKPKSRPRSTSNPITPRESGLTTLKGFISRTTSRVNLSRKTSLNSANSSYESKNKISRSSSKKSLNSRSSHQETLSQTTNNSSLNSLSSGKFPSLEKLNASLSKILYHGNSHTRLESTILRNGTFKPERNCDILLFSDGLGIALHTTDPKTPRKFLTLLRWINHMNYELEIIPTFQETGILSNFQVGLVSIPKEEIHVLCFTNQDEHTFWCQKILETKNKFILEENSTKDNNQVTKEKI